MDAADAEIDEHWGLTLQVLQGDREALAFLKALNLVVNTWDDLIDRDSPHSPEMIHDAFTALLVDIPRNAFYRQWQNELQPCIEAAIAEWRAANVFQRSGDPELIARAHVMRFNMLSVWVTCAKLCGGSMEAAWRAALLLRQEIPRETLGEFMKECGT